ncbi:MAG: DUF5305 family protein [Halobacteriales archaeon]
MELERDRSRFDEWISRGDATDDGRTEIEVESLEAVVDVAIDSSRRVVENRRADGFEYVVLVDDVRYVYRPS